ncbi:MAG: protein TolQ [Candidatus Binatia bacterium]|nr:protein TolQ [Candidatus Binatia bacterium]
MAFSVWRVAVQQEGPFRQDNIVDMVMHSGPVVQGVLYLLLAFSVCSWGIIFYKFRQIRQARRESERFIEVFWEAKNLAAISTASLEMKESPVAQVFRAGYQELMRITRGRKQANPGESNPINEEGGIENVERAMRRASREQMTRLERALTFLATTASTAPFIGLFGTVWGIMDAFIGLSRTQASTIQAVAPGIAEALIATAVGLAAAIPSVMAYNYFSRQVRVLTAEMENFSAEFLNIAERHFL